MTAENIEVRAVFEARDQASPTIRTIREGLAGLERQVQSLNKLFSAGPGADLARSFDGIASKAKALGTALDETGERTVRTLKADTVAALALRDAYREVAAAQDAVARGAGRGAGGRSGSGSSSGGSGENGRPGGRGAAANPYADIRARWRIREASQAAELRHLSSVRREREAIERSAMRAGREAFRHGRHALRSVNHPALESPGHAAALGAAFGIAAGEHIVRASEAFDTSMSRLHMFAPGLDADAIRRQALSDSISLGVSADKIVDSISKSVRDGVPPAIAESLPKSIAQTAQVMGGDIERLTDSLAEGIQEATSMGWIKNKVDARLFLNLEAGRTCSTRHGILAPG